ncbi:CD109 antigen-like protein, partial [Leptotrombidium deliense]
VPLNARPGNYYLQVEGNANGVLGGTGFVNKALVNYESKFLTILIQTNKLVYNLMQSIKIRVILLNTQMKPYVDPIDIYLL